MKGPARAAGCGAGRRAGRALQTHGSGAYSQLELKGWRGTKRLGWRQPGGAGQKGSRRRGGEGEGKGASRSGMSCGCPRGGRG